MVICDGYRSPARAVRLVFLFGKRKFVVLTSAVEDFEGRTLSVIPGLLGKLRYVNLLRGSGGGFSHWGLEKVHGASGAEQGIRSAHRSLIAQVLRTPMRELTMDLRRSAASAEIADYDLLLSLEKPWDGPAGDEKVSASEKHFTSVLHTLSALLQNEPPASPQNESQRRPPVQ